VPGVSIFDRLQENAVATGLAYQSGVLSAKKKDILLLDIVPWQLGMMVEKYRESVPEYREHHYGFQPRALDVLEISCNDDDNCQFYNLFNRKIRDDIGLTIPTKQEVIISIQVERCKIVEIDFVDRDRQSGSDEKIATLHIDLEAKPYPVWRITTDIDANAFVTMEVAPEANTSDIVEFSLFMRADAGSFSQGSRDEASVWLTLP